MQIEKIKNILDFNVIKYNQPEFINNDPISIPHLFSKKEDIEKIGLLTATISWGNRKAIINSAKKFIKLLDNKPYEFVMNYKEKDYHHVEFFKHRTFNGFDLHFFLLSLQNIYKTKGGLEKIFSEGFNKNGSSLDGIENFRNAFFYDDTKNIRTKKHVSSPFRGSASKRLNMYLRWMVRRDNNGVDFGIWKSISPSMLSCPLDVHSGNSARKIGILNRKQNDWKAVIELDNSLKIMDANDPVKYDFALFGMGLEKTLVDY